MRTSGRLNGFLIRRDLVVTVSLTIALGIPSCSRSQQASISAVVPHLELSTGRLDLGAGKPGELLRGTLYLCNTGTVPLEFSITHSCGCSELDPKSGTIAPGEQQAIAVGVTLPSYANSERAVELLTRWSEPGTTDAESVARCVAVARCPAPFQVSPLFLNLGSFTPGEVGQATAKVHVAALNGGAAFSPEQLIVRHGSKAFHVEKTIPGDGSAFITVSITTDVAQGEHYDTIELQLEDSDQLMKVPVNVQVVEPLSVVPSTVFLRADGATGEFRPVDLFVVSRGADSQLGHVRVVDAPSGVRIEDLGSVGNARRRVRLFINQEADWEQEAFVKVWSEGGTDLATLKLVRL